METEYSLYYEEPSHLYRHLLMESDHETALLLNMSFSPASSTSTTGGTDASMATADGSDACTQTDEHNSCPFSNLKCEEEEEEDFEYEDDRDDDEYVPKSRPNKKGSKSKYRPYGNYPKIGSFLLSPGAVNSRGKKGGDVGSFSCRQDNRKDRTPRTIMRMMERHRENERVRHHTLNETMKELCTRVPGYDGFTKETKVIQMQRIIGYECFLENTVLYLCHELGINPRQLNLGTHLITDKIKDYRMPDFIASSQEEVPENLKPSPQRSSSDACCIDMNRREKISSPTVDSTTGNTYAAATLRHMMSFVPSCYSQSTECSQDSMVPTQSFIPISRPLRVDLHDSQGEADEVIDFLHGEIESFFNPTINEESAKPAFMILNVPPPLPEKSRSRHEQNVPTLSLQHDDLAPTSTIDENSSFNGFDLSSPDRSVGKVFLQSPKNMSLHRHGDVEGSEALESKELTSISPESILETKPREKFFLNSTLRIVPSLDNTTVESGFQSTDRQSGIITIHSSSDCNQGFKSNAQSQSKHPFFISSESRSNSESEEELEAQNRPPWGRENMYHCTVNKRKCFIPRRAPFHIISGNSNKSFKKNLESEKFQTVSADDDGRKDDDDDDDDTDEEIDEDLMHFSRNEKSGTAEMKTNMKVDHRRTTWMNGFMMFSQLNRRKFINANPGVHTSHISKMMGHVWRNMTAEEQKPYKDKAKTYSNYIRGAYEMDLFRDKENFDSVVPTSTTTRERDLTYGNKGGDLRNSGRQKTS